MLRDFQINAINASEPTYGVVYITNGFDCGLDDIQVYYPTNSVANGIFVADSGGVKIKDVRVYGSDVGGGSSNTKTGILVANNSQISLDNVDVEGFDGTGGKGIATSGAFVDLDIISSHTEDDYYDYYHATAYDGYVTAKVDNGSGGAGNILTVTSVAALTSVGTTGVTLSVTPTSVGGSGPTVSGYLEFYGVDYIGNQSVVPD